MFRSTLGDDRRWSNVIPSLVSAPLNLREANLETHDLTIYLPTLNTALPQKLLHLLLLTPLSLESGPALVERIDRLSVLNVNATIGLIFLMDSTIGRHKKYQGVHGLMELQAILFTHFPQQDISVLPLHTPQRLASLLSTYHDATASLAHEVVSSMTAAPPAISLALSLLQTSTTSLGGLSEHAVNVFTDLFPSFAELANAAVSQDGRHAQVVKDFIGTDEGSGVLEYWREEWSD